MSKRNITFTKPEEPNFLKRLKQQIGYKEGPTVDTKRADLGPAEDLSDQEDDLPTVVVLNEGDLSAQEAQREKDRLEKEVEETPADLEKPIVFKPRSKTEPAKDTSTQSEPQKSGAKKEKPKKVKSKTLLSFDPEEDDE